MKTTLPPISSLAIAPITLRAANAFVAQHHRHSVPVRGCRWAIALYDGETLVGVAVAGRPISRLLDDGRTLEILRVCTDGTPNACSMLYGRCRRIAREMGYRVVLTYTLASEPGTSLQAAGAKRAGITPGKQWDRPSRRRPARIVEDRIRWEL